MTTQAVPIIITLLSDFGTTDYFVGAMKGVILGSCPGATLVDISHDIAPHDVRAAAFTLRAASECYPRGTIHLAVVDPGVGSDRRALLVDGDQRYVGPDNGLFGMVLQRERQARVYRITADHLFRKPLSSTFHGRDVFAPIAAALGNGVPADELGVEITDPVRLTAEAVTHTPEGDLLGAVIHIDRFGNCVTNIERRPGVEETLSAGFALTLSATEVRALRRHYAEPVGAPDELFAIWGSAGLLEISTNGRSAAERMDVTVGTPVLLRMQPGAENGGGNAS